MLQKAFVGGLGPMTVRQFGRVVPIQIAMLQLVGYSDSGFEMEPATGNQRKRAMMAGANALKQATNADLGYDAGAWRDFLIDAGDEFGYTHPYAFLAVDKAVQAAMADPGVSDALSLLESGNG